MDIQAIKDQEVQRVMQCMMQLRRQQQNLLVTGLFR